MVPIGPDIIWLTMTVMSPTCREVQYIVVT